MTHPFFWCILVPEAFQSGWKVTDLLRVCLDGHCKQVCVFGRNFGGGFAHLYLRVRTCLDSAQASFILHSGCVSYSCMLDVYDGARPSDPEVCL